MLAVFSSIGLHLAVLSVLSGAPAVAQSAARSAESRDNWRGDTVDVETLLAQQSDLKSQAPGTRPSLPAHAVAKPAAPPSPEPTPAVEKEPKPKRPPGPAQSESKLAEAPSKPQADPPPQRPKSPQPPVDMPRPRSGPAAASASTDQPEPAADGDAGAAPKSGSVTDLPPGVRRLDKAFVRAITAATHRDPYWRQLPAGPVGSVQVRLSVDEEGKLGEIITEPETPVEAMTRLLERTRAMLLRGRFAVPSGHGAGKIELSIDVLLRDDPRAEDEDNPHAAVTLGFDPPTATHSGRAYFLLASGRYFEAKVALK